MEIMNKIRSKRIITLLLAFVMVIGLASTAFAAFTDIPAGHWSEDYVNNLSERGIISGRADDTFGPNDPILRQHVAKMIALARELELGDGTTAFDDVQDGNEFAKYIAATNEAGIFKGVSADEFGWGNNITRRQIASVIVRAFELEMGPEEVKFEDIEEIKDLETKENIEILASNGIVQNTEKFNPNGNATRAQFAKMLVEAEAVADKEPEVLEVVSVSAIDKTKVEVIIKAAAEDMDEATVVVIDNKGNVVPTKSELVMEGQTEVEFDFVTAFEDDYKFEGVWSVDGVEYNFDAINQLADILAAAAGENEVELLEALEAAGIQNLDEDLITKYKEAINAADDDETEDLAGIQEIIKEVNEDEGKAIDEEAAYKAVKEAENQVQLLNALTANFERVNKDWIVQYQNHMDILKNNAKDYDWIQAEIDAINNQRILAANTAAGTAADQAKVTALIEAWMKPDTTTPKVTAKAEAIEASKLAEAAFKVVEANTPNRIYAALVSFADLADDEDVIDSKKIKEENKQYYFDVVNPEEGQYEVPEAGITAAPADIVEQGNTEAKQDQQAIDGRISSVHLGARPHDKGYTGYSVNVYLDNEEEVKEVVIELYNGEDLLSTNTGTTKLVELANKDTTEHITSVFDIFDDFDYEEDGYWINSGWAGDAFDTPTEVKVTIVYSDATAEKTEPFVVDNSEAIANIFIEDINEAEEVAEVKATLDILADGGLVKDYLTVRTVDRDFVAAYVLDERPENGYENIDAVEAVVNGDDDGEVGAVAKLQKAIDDVNDIERTTSIDAIVDALEATLDEDFNALSNTAKVASAEAFYDQLSFNADGELTPKFVTLAAIKALI